MLPPELMLEVLANLDGNTKTLTSCALACKALSVPSQTFLFSSVELHFYTSVPSFAPDRALQTSREEKLLRVLQTRPELIPLVRNASIYDLFGGEDILIGEPEVDSGLDQNPFVRNDEALRVLELLEHSKSLIIHGFNTKSWKHLDEGIQSVLLKAFRFPNIEFIKLNAMAWFPIPLLGHCADKLKHLTVTTMPSLRLAYDHATELDDHRFHLESLTISTSTPELEKFVRWIFDHKVDLTRLNKLVVSTLGNKHQDVQPLVWKLAKACASTLKELDFFAYLPYGRTDITSLHMLALYDTIDLGKLISLQKLTIRYWLGNVCGMYTSRQLILLCRILRTICAATSLKELVLHFVVVLSSAPIDVSGSRYWDILDTTLAEYAPLGLQNVTLHFENIQEQHRRKAMEMVSAGLPRLNSSKILVVQARDFSSSGSLPLSC